MRCETDENSASSDGRIRSERRAEQRQDDNGGSATVVAACDSSVKCLLAVGDGLVLSSHQDGKIRAWRAGSLKDGSRHLAPRAVLPTFVDRLRTFLLPWSYVQVRRYRWRTWVHHVDAATALAVSSDGALLYSASWDRSLKACAATGVPVHRVRRGRARRRHQCAGGVPQRARVHGLGRQEDQGVEAPPGAEEQARARADDGAAQAAVNALALGVDGKVLYSSASDRSVVVWERAGDGRMEATDTLRGHKKAILCLAAAGDVVCSGSADRTVRVWRRRTENTGYTCL
ncbi:hypothetical protein SETIT_6G249500v2 [Setaria italica]|uniref:Uncharacterized protein n=1 Tax=Setaria italica TaxID=4555 RepID=A0A368RQA3_SETIT|nr:hypothetical protein SETIT_6G249500v2 [Setaria italica]